MHLGPADAVHWMREEAARGCDAAVRVWDDELALVGTQAKALVLAAAVRSHGADLVLTGTANAASAGGQLGVLLARHLGVPCVTNASRVACPSRDGGRRRLGRAALHVTRDLARGYRERVAVALPAVVTVVPGDDDGELASLPSLLRAQESDIPVWDLATLGVGADQLRKAGQALRPGELRPPRPPMRYIAAPMRRRPPSTASCRSSPAAYGVARGASSRGPTNRSPRRSSTASCARAGSITCARRAATPDATRSVSCRRHDPPHLPAARPGTADAERGLVACHL